MSIVVSLVRYSICATPVHVVGGYADGGSREAVQSFTLLLLLLLIQETKTASLELYNMLHITLEGSVPG